MLLRFIVENFLSFNKPTEFNLFPNSRTQRLGSHKTHAGHTDVLRLSAIYGANAAGKSNLIEAIAFLRSLVLAGQLKMVDGFYENNVFRFSDTGKKEPVSFAIEFSNGNKVFYYMVSIMDNYISNEELYESRISEDRVVFKRTTDAAGKSELSFSQEYQSSAGNRTFAAVLEDKILRKEMLVLSFMAMNYPGEIKEIDSAYDWFNRKLETVAPEATVGVISHMLDKNGQMMELLNALLPKFETGIKGMEIQKNIVDEQSAALSPEWKQMIPVLKSRPGMPYPIMTGFERRVSATAVYENGQVVLKVLVPVHQLPDGRKVKMSLGSESDGTLRLINYIPLIYSILNEDKVFIVDEIERSLHPILIKEILKKISASQSACGQLIFTTHESCLLDQNLLRPDEIWMAEKDSTQATRLYPLSDFNIHHTANIENGYLKGRYGGIPFLSNLKDLHW